MYSFNGTGIKMAKKRVLRCEKLSCGAFTLVELIIVVVILSIAALLAVPMMSSAADSQLRSGPNLFSGPVPWSHPVCFRPGR